MARGAMKPESPFQLLRQPAGKLFEFWVKLSAQPSSQLSYLDEMSEQLESSGVGAAVLMRDEIYIQMYLNELMYHLMPKAAVDQSLFDLYDHLMRYMGEKENLERQLRQFECHLLKVIGYEVNFTIDEEGDAVLAEAYYEVRPQLPPKLMKKGLETVPGACLLNMSDAPEYWHRVTLKYLKRIMRQNIQALFGFKTIRSREFFQYT